jgi:hypothetical protein
VAPAWEAAARAGLADDSRRCCQALVEVAAGVHDDDESSEEGESKAEAPIKAAWTPGQLPPPLPAVAMVCRPALCAPA